MQSLCISEGCCFVHGGVEGQVEGYVAIKGNGGVWCGQGDGQAEEINGDYCATEC